MEQYLCHEPDRVYLTAAAYEDMIDKIKAQLEADHE